MERYLGDETIDISELAGALASGIATGTVFPVLCGSATKLIGIDRLAKFLVEEAPAPTRRRRRSRRALVFKTIVDSVRRARELLQGAPGHREARRRAHQQPHARPTSACTSSSRCAARSRTPSTEVAAGDIAAVAKLTDTSTGDVLAAKGTTVDVETVEPPAAGARGRDQGPLEGRRGQARQRAAPPAGRRPRVAHRAQPRDAPDGAARHGRDPPVDRAREAGPQVRRRGRHRRRARRVPRDDHRQRPRPRAS